MAVVSGIIVPVILSMIGLWLLPKPQNKSNPPKDIESAGNEFVKVMKSIPMAVWIEWSIWAVSILIGAVGAWYHIAWLMVVFGIVMTFIAWALMQINRSRIAQGLHN